jgi:glycosyltransferase involved in cell wall biosynthesis
VGVVSARFVPRFPGPLVTVDARMIEASGIGTYLKHLLPRVLAGLPEARLCLLGRPSELTPFDWTRDERVTVKALRAGVYSPFEQLAVLRATPPETDLLWIPHINLPVLYRGKLLVTVHDAYYADLRRPVGTRWDKRVYTRALMSALVRRADFILTVSAFTRQELEDSFGPLRQPVRAVPIGVDQGWFDLVRGTERPHPRPYLLYVGNLRPNKNVPGLLEAFRRLGDRWPHDLVIAGRDFGMAASLSRQVRALGDRVRFTGHLPLTELRQLYAHADALVLPSFYEGFGLPPLEAMACGVPVAVSRRASLPEVCGDAAVYFDHPENPGDIAAGLERLLGSETLRQELIARGRKRARGFTWQSCSEGTLEAIRGLLA